MKLPETVIQERPKAGNFDNTTKGGIGELQGAQALQSAVNEQTGDAQLVTEGKHVNANGVDAVVASTDPASGLQQVHYAEIKDKNSPTFADFRTTSQEADNNAAQALNVVGASDRSESLFFNNVTNFDANDLSYTPDMESYLDAKRSGQASADLFLQPASSWDNTQQYVAQEFTAEQEAGLINPVAITTGSPLKAPSQEKLEATGVELMHVETPSATGEPLPAPAVEEPVPVAEEPVSEPIEEPVSAPTGETVSEPIENPTPAPPIEETVADPILTSSIEETVADPIEETAPVPAVEETVANPTPTPDSSPVPAPTVKASVSDPTPAPSVEAPVEDNSMAGCASSAF